MGDMAFTNDVNILNVANYKIFKPTMQKQYMVFNIVLTQLIDNQCKLFFLFL